MDVPAHILDAVQISDVETPSRKSSRHSLARQFRQAPRFERGLMTVTARSSAEDVSTTSDSDRDHDYQTDFTTPACSDSYPEDTQSDDVEDFRDREYPQLVGKTYLDHGGTTLYARSLVEEFSKDLIHNLYGNPHSASSPSTLSGHRVDAIRERALRFFNADPNEFDLIFVANATAAIKMVIDCFKDHASASNTPVWYGYHRDAHTSLVGVREATKMHRCFTSDEEVDIWINSGGLGGPRARQLGLFAYPGQSNMTGRRLPLSWPGRIRKSFHKAATYTLLDAAALASTSPLDLSDPATAPDFTALSFYKIFGFPNLGALIVRKDSAHVLESRKFFGGGTVDMIIAINDTWHAKKETSIHDRLEDGTLPFHNIFALDHAINTHQRLYGPDPMKAISHHTTQLGRQLYEGLSGLRHTNGSPVCRIYKDDSAVYGDPTVQGATVAFNVMRSDGSLIGFETVEQAADARNIFVRSGSLCNPGGVATYLEWSPAEMKAAYAAGHRCSNPTQVMFGKATGVVRVSLGAMSVAQDIHALLKFLSEEYVGATLATLPTLAPVLGRTASLPQLKVVTSTGQPENLASLLETLPPWRSPSTAASDGDGRAWGEISALPSCPPAMPAQSEEQKQQKNPPFVQADYAKRHKPWQEEMRKHATTFNYNTEIKVREVEDAGSLSRNGTPSFKARKFGRSMVNLLRAKERGAGAGSGNGGDYSQRSPDVPQTTGSSRFNHNGNGNSNSGNVKAQDAKSTGSSRRSVERQQFKANIASLGL